MIYNKTIKFFISSTFKDFEQERNILQKFVFPKLIELCHKNGFGFQPIDLRWGIQEEAGIDQQTMNICLNEIKRSSSEPKPNLLILVGQRYGWIPLPYEINEDEFNRIIESNELTTEEKDLIVQWYEKDENTKDTIYFLKDKYTINRDDWNKIEDQIRDAFQKTSSKDSIYHKSAIEQEMFQGLDGFDKTKKHEHTFLYFRKINNYNIKNEDIEDYIDIKEIDGQKVLNLNNIDNLSKKLQEKANIPEKNQIKQENINWNEIDKSKNISYENLTLENAPEYLLKFHDEILERFTTSIQEVMTEFKKDTQLQIELKLQKNFLENKSQIVLGRTNEIKRILEFIKDDSKQYYLLYGKSGSGKTSVIAKTITVLKEKNTEYDIYYRFIGVTANSTYSRVLFENIYWEIESRLLNKKKLIKPDMKIEEREFKKQFKSQLTKLQNKKTIIFLDALDQFEDYNDLTILLEELPSNIKVILSTLYDEEKKENLDYSQYYKRLDYLENKYELKALGKDINETILKQWLRLKKRELISSQWNYIKPFIHDITPLHLKLIFEIIKHWKSEQKEYYLENTQEKLIIQFFDFVKKQYHHEEKLLKQTLGYISASKDGLSEEELLDLLSEDKDFLEIFQNDKYPKLSRLPNAIWSRFYFYIEPFFTEKLIDGEILIKPYHRIIEEVIKDTYYKNNKIYLHEKLSFYFYSHQEKTKTWEERYYSLRMLSELPHQLYYSKNSDKLKEILFDLEFAGSIYNNSKQNSFNDIMSKAINLEGIFDDEIYPLESFYIEKEYLILKVNDKIWKPHQTLFQLAYEDGENSPLTNKADLILKNKKILWNWYKPSWRSKYYYRTGLLKTLTSDYSSQSIYINENKIVLYDYESVQIINIARGKNIKIFTKMSDIDKVIKINNDLIMIWGDFIELLNLNSLKTCEIEEDETFIAYSINDDQTISVLFDSGIIRIYDYLGNILESISNYKNELLKVWETFKYDDLEQINILSNLIKVVMFLDVEIVYKVCNRMINDKITWLLYNTNSVLLSDTNLLTTLYGPNEFIDYNTTIWASDDNLILYDNCEDLLYESNIEKIGDPSQIYNCSHYYYEPSNFKKLNKFLKGYSAMWNISATKIIVSNHDDDRIELVGHKGNVQNVLEYKNKLLSWDDSGCIVLWSWEKNELSFEEVCIGEGQIQNVFINSNSIITIRNKDNENIIQIWNINNNMQYDVGYHTDKINGLLYDNNKIFSWSDDGKIRVWTNSGKKIKVLDNKNFINLNMPVDEVIPWYDGTIITWSTSYTGSLKKWDLYDEFENGQEISIDYQMRKYTNYVKDNINFVYYFELESYKYILSCYINDNNIVINNKFDSQILKINHRVFNAFSCNKDKLILIGTKKLTILKLEFDKFDIYHELSFNNNIITVRFSDNFIIHLDDKILVYNTKFEYISKIDLSIEIIEVFNNTILCVADTCINTYDFEGNLLYTLEHEEPIKKVEIISNINRVLTYSDKLIKVWSKTQNLKRFDKHTEPILGLIYCKNRAIVSFSKNHLMIFWDTIGSHYISIKLKCELLGIIELDNSNFAAWSENAIFIWNNKGELIKQILPKISQVDKLLELNDGTYISNSNGKLTHWDNSGYFISKLEDLPQKEKFNELVIDSNEINTIESLVSPRKSFARQQKELLIPYKLIISQNKE